MPLFITLWVPASNVNCRSDWIPNFKPDVTNCDVWLYKSLYFPTVIIGSISFFFFFSFFLSEVYDLSFKVQTNWDLHFVSLCFLDRFPCNFEKYNFPLFYGSTTALCVAVINKKALGNGNSDIYTYLHRSWSVPRWIICDFNEDSKHRI